MESRHNRTSDDALLGDYRSVGSDTAPEDFTDSTKENDAAAKGPVHSSKENDAATEDLTEPNKKSDGAAEGFYQRLQSHKIRSVYFLVVSLSLIIVIIVLSVHRPQSVTYSGDERTTKGPMHSSTVSTTTAAKASSTTHEEILCVQCDDGWTIYKGKCYYLSGDAKSWTDSLTYCTEHNSWLAIINNTEEYDFLKNIKGENNRWIGLSNRGNGSGWVWADGKPHSPNIFQIGQVTNAGDMEYAYLTSDGVKNTTKGFLQNKFFCTK